MEANAPRIMIAGTSSGCGKTTLTCGLLQALVNRNIISTSFKCGPDYIDPMFHEKIIGTKSANLDPFFFEENTLKHLFIKHAEKSEISIIEGVMGFYDGMALNTSVGSTYHVAKMIDTPVILTVNCKGLALSAIAIIKGFLELREDSNIKGVILNHMSKTTYQVMKELIEGKFHHKIKVLGYMPKLHQDMVFKSRHLGLVTTEEIENLKDKMNQLASIVEETIDIEGILELSKTAPSLNVQSNSTPVIKANQFHVRIAVAKDNAFCFYYKDNIALLKELGAQIKYFSPIHDQKLPLDIDGIYLGGGYPELYLKELSGNLEMRHAIKVALEDNIPCIAECGGFMYLNETIDDIPMVGFLKGQCRNQNQLVRFGYVTMEAKKNNLLCSRDGIIKAHEFHYYDCDENGSTFSMTKANGKSWKAVIGNDYFYGGFPHIHFYANLEFAYHFLDKCVERKRYKDER